MLGIILIVVLVGVVGTIAFVAAQPSDFRVTRSVVVSAAPEPIFAQVNDLRKWQAWSPWEKMDPAMKKTFQGPPSGVGAGYSWVGNQKVGEG